MALPRAGRASEEFTIRSFVGSRTGRLLLYVGLLAYTAVLATVLVFLVDETPGSIASAVRDDDPEARAAPTGETIEVQIEDGSTADVIANLLASQGVVADSSSLRVLIALTEAGPHLQAGRYEFALGLPPGEVLDRLLLGPDLIEMITFREGLRVEEIGVILEREEIATEEEWQAALDEPLPERFDVILADRSEGADLTGYLLPATFDIEEDTTALDLLHRMLDAFIEQVSQDLIDEAREQGLSLHELLTMAAIVEREAVHPEESPVVASVFLNRLEVDMPLQADPTVQFAVTLGPDASESIAQHGYWKNELSVADLELDSAYNTYVYRGLPPGPIANPGLTAIEAVVYPDETEYYYFVAHPDCDGRHLFAETLDEHNENVSAFRASGCGDQEVAPDAEPDEVPDEQAAS